MLSASIVATVAMLGTDFGWQPTDAAQDTPQVAVESKQVGWEEVERGEYELVIQIEPAQFERLMDGGAVISEVPDDLQTLRRFRIKVGSDELPRAQIEPTNAAPAEPKLPENPTPKPAEPEKTPSRYPAGPADTTPTAEPPSRYGEPDSVPPANPLRRQRDDTHEADPAPAPPTPEKAPAEPAPSESPAKKDDVPDRYSSTSDANAESDSETNMARLIPPAMEPPSLPPAEIEPDPDSRALGEQVATFRQEVPGDGTSKKTDTEPGPTADIEQASAAGDQYWVPYPILLAILAGSLGLNFFMGWITRDARKKYRGLLDRFRNDVMASA